MGGLWDEVKDELAQIKTSVGLDTFRKFVIHIINSLHEQW